MSHYKAFVMGLLTVVGCISIANPVAAKLTRLEITSEQNYGTFQAGKFVLMEGRIIGSLAPSEAIPDLAKANRNAQGLVEYAAKITLIVPEDPARGNGTLLFDIPNRGRTYALALYNSPRDEPFEAGTLEVGTGFLQEQGYALASVKWELGQGAELPSFTDDTGKQQFIEGVGFAIVRDAANFLRRSSTDDTGRANPLRGAIKRTVASGKSQSGRFLKSFLLHGFNRLGDRRVFDGMHVIVSGAGVLPIMRSSPGPVSSGNKIPLFTDPDVRGVNEEVLTIADLLHRLDQRNERPPRLIFLNSTTDYFSLRASLARTGASGTSETEIPSAVRVYDVAGASHVVVSKADCELPPARLDWSPILRATLVHLDAWVAKGVAPPANRLMPLEPAGSDPTVLRKPAHLPNAVIEVPKRDEDGNAEGGVRLPDIAVPLGVHAKQNPPLSFACMLAAAYVPFPRTQTDAAERSDKLRPVLDRYKTRADYVDRVRAAARNLVKDRFILPDDAAIIIHSAAENPLWRIGTAPR